MFTQGWTDAGLAVIVLAILGVAATLTATRPDPLPSAPFHSALPATGTDTTAFLFVSSTCGACTDESSVPLVLQSIGSFHESATRRVVGVALDQDMSAGLDVLKLFGAFDELILGGSWRNVAALHHVWSDSTAIGAVPQLVLVERRFEEIRGRIAVTMERVLLRVYGFPAITEALKTPDYTGGQE